MVTFILVFGIPISRRKINILVQGAKDSSPTVRCSAGICLLCFSSFSSMTHLPSSSLCHNYMLQELQMDCCKIQFYWHTWLQERWWPLHTEASLPLPRADWQNKDDVLTSSDCSLVCTGEDLLPTVSRWQGNVSPDAAKVICKASNGSSLNPQSQLKAGGRV